MFRGVVLQLPSNERRDVVHRLIGTFVSDERASLILEQRDVNNHDFDDLAWVHNEKAWYEALRVAYSPRALEELIRLDQIKLPSPELTAFARRALKDGGDYGLALAKHLKQLGDPKVDILCNFQLLYALAREVKHPRTVQYILHRLLNANDPSFTVLTQCCWERPHERFGAFAQLCLGNSPRPLEVVVFRFCRVERWYNPFDLGERVDISSVPLLDLLFHEHPEARALLLHYNVLFCMFDHGAIQPSRSVADLITDEVRPLDTFTFVWNTTADSVSALDLASFSYCYGSLTITWSQTTYYTNKRMYSWILQDWLKQACQTNQWATGFVEMFRWCEMSDEMDSLKPETPCHQYRYLLIKLVQSVPDEVLTEQFTRHPTLLRSFYKWPSVPSRLLALVPFQAWREGLTGVDNKSDCDALRFFGAHQRVLLREA
jgi:hypothetical protein